MLRRTSPTTRIAAASKSHVTRTTLRATMSKDREGLPAGFFLKTFGTPGLLVDGVQAVPALRRKDLALLIFLQVETGERHSRAVLANLLWGDFEEENARHSLTQALSRLRLLLGCDSMSLSEQNVEWKKDIVCDAALLEHAAIEGSTGDPLLHCYSGDFLNDFHLQHGAEGFDVWSAEKRVHFRRRTVELLQERGRLAEERCARNAAPGRTRCSLDSAWWKSSRSSRRVIAVLCVPGARSGNARWRSNTTATLLIGCTMRSKSSRIRSPRHSPPIFGALQF
jgi:hypothetical protein